MCIYLSLYIYIYTYTYIHESPLQARIAAFLEGRATQLNSRVLALASQRVAADPFTKVKKMIKERGRTARTPPPVFVKINLHWVY